MARQRIDLTGKKFGMLTALKPTDRKASSSGVVWLCKCECGRECYVVASALRSGDIQSCGCLRKRVEVSQDYRKSKEGRNAGLAKMLRATYKVNVPVQDIPTSEYEDYNFPSINIDPGYIEALRYVRGAGRGL